MNRVLTGIAVAAALALGLALRLPDLANRPMHGDEAVHAAKFRDLHFSRTYRYDPDEYHGPTLYYATAPVMALQERRGFGATTEVDYRLVTALFGAAIILLVPLLRDGLGAWGTVMAALLLAASPAMAYYSRYYIQESLLVFFTVAALAFGWRYVRERTPALLGLAGACGGLMVATKETAPLAFVCVAAALLLNSAWSRRSAEPPAPLRERIQGKHLAAAAAVGVAVAALFLSTMGSNPAGPIDYLRSYTPWLSRAGGSTLHAHGWDFYLGVLGWSRRPNGPIWTEAFILVLALAGTAAAIRGRRALPADASVPFARVVLIYTALTAAAYTLIPYKTPWLVLNILAPLALLAGIGAGALVHALRGSALPRAALVAAAAAGTAHLAWLAWQTCFVYPTDARNPYAYAQPSPDVVELGKRVEDVANAHPQHGLTPVKVFSVDDYHWPLPWYLRRMPNVGYWNEVPEDAGAPIVLSSPELDDAVRERLGATHMGTGIYGLRAGAFFTVWVEKGLWGAYVSTRPPEP